MNLNNYMKCDIYDRIYDISQYENMIGNGETAYSKIKIYGNQFDCCPECTNEIYNFLLQLTIKKLNK